MVSWESRPYFLKGEKFLEGVHSFIELMSFLHTTGCALQTEQQVSHLGHAGEKLKPFSGEKTPEGRWDMAKGQLGGGGWLNNRETARPSAPLTCLVPAAGRRKPFPASLHI